MWCKFHRKLYLAWLKKIGSNGEVDCYAISTIQLLNPEEVNKLKPMEGARYAKTIT